MPTYPKKLRTPEQVQRWLKSLAYNKDETMYGLVGVARRGRAHCLEAALSAAAILEQHGYPPLILDLESADLFDHTLFLFKRNGEYGAVGKSRDIGLDGRKPVFKTVSALVASYAIPYIDHRAEITGYAILDLRTLKNQQWRTSQKNVWYIEEALRNIPHRKFSSAVSIKKWRKRFIAFQRQHPDRQPDFYPNQPVWL